MLYIIQSILYRKNELTASNLLGEINDFINLLPAWDEKPKEWLMAHPSKTMIALGTSDVTSEATEYIDNIIHKKKSVSIVLAGEKKDESPIIFWFKNTPAISESRYSLTLAIRSPQTQCDKKSFLQILTKMLLLTPWKYRYILIETEQYRMEQKAVFDDRLPAGWMLYLPKIIECREVPSASEIIYLPGKSGTVIITKDEFNGKNEMDITCANNVEIELAANGHLPKWLDL